MVRNIIIKKPRAACCPVKFITVRKKKPPNRWNMRRLVKLEMQINDPEQQMLTLADKNSSKVSRKRTTRVLSTAFEHNPRMSMK